jgi:site-specific recombinase XerD
MFKHSIAATINLQRPDNLGKYPVRIRVTIARHVTYHATGIMLDKQFWDAATRAVISHPQKSYYNGIIRRKISDLEAELLEAGVAGQNNTFVKKKQEIKFEVYAKQKIEAAIALESQGTHTHKVSYLKKFCEFRPDIKLHQVTAQVLTDYENYCRNLGNVGNTIWSSTKYILTVVNAAIKDGSLRGNPIKNFSRTKYIAPVRRWLTVEDIALLEKFVKNTTVKQYRDAANWFLFSCYCGLRYGDVVLFTKEAIKNDKIILRTSKKKADVTIKLHPKLKVCVERMNYKVPTNQDYNRLLKAVALAGGIDKPLTSHIARHTFAVQFLDGGGSMEVLSKLMGHSTTKTTAIYGKITDKRVDAEVEKVFGK